MSADRMTKGERDDLVRLVKQRERVAKTAAEQRSAAMLAEFEQQISALHDFNTNEVWKAATDAAIAAAKKANEEIAAEAERLGIPKEFRPSLSYGWVTRGENEYAQRRAELRRVAKAEIDAIEKVARVQIEASSVQAQTEIIANGLNSDAALAFLNSLPAIESMMPPLDVSAIQAKLAERARGQGYRPHLVQIGDD
jgi:hypothetical protein